jgi:hypothetical protein
MGGTQFDGASGGTVTFCNVPGASARLTFEGSEVAWLYTKAMNRGRAVVLIDGKGSEVDLYSRETVWQAVTTFSGLGPGRTHRGPRDRQIRRRGRLRRALIAKPLSAITVILSGGRFGGSIFENHRHWQGMFGKAV